jgi:hypothetical protein
MRECAVTVEKWANEKEALPTPFKPQLNFALMLIVLDNIFKLG